MCGVAGCVVSPDRPVDRPVLERMAAALRHRGPDDQGVEVVGNVGLAHTRLAILDPTPSGHQPMRDAASGWWLAYNGEAFNHLELRAHLPARDWLSGTDTETLLHALATHGEDAVPLANGLFAYAALDPQRGRLLLVRDRFGVKPLYLARHAGALLFASEIGALLAAGVPRDPDVEVLHHAVDRGWATGRRTPLRAVHSVGPGTLVSIDLRTLELEERRWYDPAGAVDPARASELATLDADGCREALEAALRASVRRRLLADVPVGVMCSGGVDSSLVTALAAEAQPDVLAFTASITDQPENDELAFGRLVARHLGVELHAVPFDAADWRRDFVACVRHLEAPMLHPGSIPMFRIAALARERGVKVLLSGEGADELFGGYGFLHGQERAAFERELASPAARARRALLALAGRATPLPGSTVAEPGHGPSEEVAAAERRLVAANRAAYAHHPPARAAFEAALLTDLSTYLPHLLNRQDKMTMQASVETRVPFLDPDVVALALNLPLEHRIRPWPKGVLGELARRRIPREAVDRPKMGFGFDAARYLAGVRPDFVTEGRLRELLELGRREWSEVLPSLGGQPLLVVSGEAWCRVFLDGAGDDEVDAAMWGP
jgi:asparagine synthase (glutamine-hydrolysing)